MEPRACLWYQGNHEPPSAKWYVTSRILLLGTDAFSEGFVGLHPWFSAPILPALLHATVVTVIFG